MRILLLCLLVTNVYTGSAQDAAGPLEKIRTMISHHQYEKALERLLPLGTERLSVEILNMTGYCYSKSGQFQEAAACYERALELDSANSTALNRLAELHKGQEDYLKALALFEKLSNADSLNSYFYKQRAYCLFKAGLVTISIPLYEQAMRLNPGDEEVVLALARIYFEQEDFPSCDSLLDGALAIDTSGGRLLSLKARSKYYQKEYDSALAVLKAVFSRGDTSLSNIRLAGNAWYALNDYGKSISWFEKLPPELVEKDEYIQYMMGVSYRHLRHPEKSIGHLEKAIELGISDNISFYYQQLGLSHEEKGEVRQALTAFETARKYKEEGILYYQMARIHDYYRNDTKSALEYYKRYLASGDSSVRRAWEFSRQRVEQLE